MIEALFVTLFPVAFLILLFGGGAVFRRKTIDQDGVGQLLTMAVEQGRATRPELKVGICGEQGGDPASVDFCYKNGLTYVSCSPFRVPIARLAAAQAAIKASTTR